MKTQILLICFLLLPIGVYADSSLKAGDLERICTSSSEDERVVCSLIVKAYKDGFIEGIANGIIGAYRYDPDILAIVKDVKAKDFAPRFNKVVAQSTCIQNVQVDDLAKAFSGYVKLNPSVQAAPYRTAMFRMIEATYCKK
ncbi:hypothetical protein [Methylotuvimicrobium alcaliphilum]|uniref:hypothetical protein n=1 Tax=Methylotuvimicrobium alcaliphilum TaxID=271065 RepID=UPI0005FBC887|nr:hypothetical protein [Methylotuvimicrobium alcaliphilum]